MNIFDFSNSQIANVIIHEVGNKSKDESIRISSNEILMTDEVTKQYLMQYFISSFKFNLFYSFKHQSNIKLNEVYNYANNIFTDENSFIEQSANIAKHLYEISSHPNIKKGELYIVHITGIIINGENVDAVGIFKSENKDIYLNVDSIVNGYNVHCQKGVNVEKLDKGCIIFNVNINEGYRVAIVDSNSSDSVYWKETFLKVKEESNQYTSTKSLLKICKSFVKENNEMQPTEKIAFLNNSLSYFQSHDTFDFDEFSDDVVQESGYHNKFKTYVAEKCSDLQEEIASFPISSNAVTVIKKSIKNYIKLDSNIEIRINSKVKEVEKIVEKGYDSTKNMSFYKIYYKKEE